MPILICKHFFSHYSWLFWKICAELIYDHLEEIETLINYRFDQIKIITFKPNIKPNAVLRIVCEILDFFFLWLIKLDNGTLSARRCRGVLHVGVRPQVLSFAPSILNCPSKGCRQLRRLYTCLSQTVH